MRNVLIEIDGPLSGGAVTVLLSVIRITPVA
jgi:hypothetical protein